MTTVPSQILPLPATDATVTAGLPEAGLSVRLDPSTAISQGVIGGRKFGGRVMNWILGGFGDWLAYLRESAGERLSTTARTFTVPTETVCELLHAKSENAFDVLGAGTLLGSGNANQPVIRQNISSCQFMWDLSSILPKDAMLTSVSLDIFTNAGWSALPNNKPDLTLLAVGLDGTVLIESGTVVDGSTTAAEFNVLHTISITGLTTDLSNVQASPTTRLYLLAQGAIDTSWQPVYFKSPRAMLTSRPW